jgi:hypothetical protein
MSGLMFLAIAGLWVWMVFKLSRFVGKAASRNPRWHGPLAGGLFLVLLPLPVVDEIIGGLQFKALCEKNAVLELRVSAEEIRGKSVRSVVEPSNKDVDGSMVRIYYSRYSYRDPVSGAELLTFARYTAEGGWLIRVLSTDRRVAPLTFVSTCDPLSKSGLDFTVDQSTKTAQP